MITIIDTSQFKVKLKATIHATGRLSFSQETADVLDFEKHPFVLFARDDENQEDLYMVLVQQDLSMSMKVNSSGNYRYLPTKLMFDNFGWEYRKQSIMFDLVRKQDLDESLHGVVYKMIKRYGKTKKIKCQ